jgi:hypothetical protein
MLKAAPLLLLWLILAGFLSVIAIHDLRQRIKDAEQDVHGNTH